MSKELIERLRFYGGLRKEAADLIEQQQSELRVKDLTIGGMANELAAAQAQLKVMREALEKCAMFKLQPETIQSIVNRAFAQPADDSALREMLKAERNGLRDELAAAQAQLVKMREALEKAQVELEISGFPGGRSVVQSNK